MSAMRGVFRSALLIGILLLSTFAEAGAQEELRPFPLADFLLTGYGTANYVAGFDSDSFEHDFTALFVPIFLYRVGESVLFEGELEFEFEDAEIETEVEYAQIDYVGWSRVIPTAGKFLLPFGVFSMRYHPAWINELPSFPLLYEPEHDEVEPLLPILSDIGAMVRVAEPLAERWDLDLSFYVTQGPRIEDETEGSVEAPAPAWMPAAGVGYQVAPGEVEARVPGITIGDSFEDTNDNKLVGARVGFIRAPTFEVYLSGFYSRYDPGDARNLIGLNLAPEIGVDRFELRGEGVLLWQEALLVDGTEDTVAFPGYYVQASVRLGDFEPVARWSHLLEAELDDATVKNDAEQLALGLDYWIYASIPVKLAYEINSGFDDRLLVQWAYGF